MRSLDGCPGAAASYCYTNHLWSGEGGQYHLVGGSFVVTPGGATYAFSVRCVLGFAFNFCMVAFFDYYKIHFLQTGSVTDMPVTAPCSVLLDIAAARAPSMATAGRTGYGQVHVPKRELMPMTEN